jgi:hypothetical protein
MICTNLEPCRNAGALILKVSYGYQVGSDEDEFVHIIEEGFRLAALASIPGRFWVEAFPIRTLASICIPATNKGSSLSAICAFMGSWCWIQAPGYGS